jgi:hypothetical protein
VPRPSPIGLSGLGVLLAFHPWANGSARMPSVLVLVARAQGGLPRSRVSTAVDVGLDFPPVRIGCVTAFWT